MDDYQAIRLMQNSVGGIIDTIQKRKGDEIFMGLKSGTIDPDSVGNRPYEKQAVEAWRAADTENYMKKYSGMSHYQIQDVDPSQEDNPMHATIAYSKVMGSLAENEQVKTATMAARTQRGMEEYTLFDAKRNQVNRYIANGENDLAGNMVADMLSNSFYPGKAQYDAAKGTVKVYRKIISADDMGSPLQLENEIPLSEIGKTLNDIDGKKYSTAKAIMTDVAAKANRESLANPKQYINQETGKSIFASSIANLNDLSESYFVTYDAKGKQIQIKDINTLTGMGYMPLSEYERMAKIGEIGAKTERARAGLSKEIAQAGEATAKAGKAEAETRAINEGRPTGGKGLGKQGAIKKDNVRSRVQELLGPHIDVKLPEDVAKEEKAKSAFIQKGLKDAPMDKLNDPKAMGEYEKTLGSKYDKMVYGDERPVTVKDDDTGLWGEYYEKSGSFVVKGYSGKEPVPEGQGGTNVVPPEEGEQKPEPKKAGLSATAPKEDKKKVTNIASGLKADAKKDDTYTNTSGQKFRISQLKDPGLKNGVLWALINGKTVRVQTEPSKEAYSYGHLAPNPEYANYMNLLKKLGLK